MKTKKSYKEKNWRPFDNFQKSSTFTWPQGKYNKNFCIAARPTRVNKPVAHHFGSSYNDLEMTLPSNMKIFCIFSHNAVFHTLYKQKTSKN